MPVSNVSLAEKMASLTLETATKPSATSGTLIERNRYKLEVEILPTAEGLVSSVKIQTHAYSLVSWAMCLLCGL